MSRWTGIGLWRGAAIAAVLAGGVAGGVSIAQTIPRTGYLGEAASDTLTLAGSPPEKGSARDEADRAIYRATRALKGTPRWTMAQADFDERAVVGNLSCAAGVKLDLAKMPATMKLILGMAPDVLRGVNTPKQTHLRPRPYRVDPGETCGVLPASEDNYDYPSGHAAWGWAVGLVLAEILPERADAILVRARAVGEGRAICGVHNYSSVVAGQSIGAAIVAREHASAQFQTDLAAAKAELAAAAKAGPAPTGCEEEAKALATPAW